MILPIIYTIISILTAGIGFWLSYQSFQKKSKMGKFLGYTCASASIVNLSYLFSIFLNQYFLVSLLTSIYFATIDIMLYCLLGFVHMYTKQPDTRFSLRVKMFLTLYLICDIAIQMVNPFKEISVRYEHRDTLLGSYTFKMLPLYNLHLLLTYGMIVLVLIRLVQKIHRTPSVYRIQYMLSVFGIIAVVIYNAVFLFSSRSSAFDFLDYSVWGYSFCAFFLYWNCFNYATHGMMNHFRNWIMEGVNQGIVLFDYEDNLLAKNENAVALFSEGTLNDQTTLNEFLEETKISRENISSGSKHSFQCFKTSGGAFSLIRCDYQALKSDSNEVLGKLFVFTDSSYESDLLTGFHNWDYFQKVINSSEKQSHLPITVSICDINGLQNINDTMGRHVGDRAISILAKLLRQNFPLGTYFIRGNEASLISLTFGEHTVEEIQDKLKQVQKQYNETQDLGCFLDIQSSVSQIDPENSDVLTAVHLAERAMKAKKLMDKNSSHSELMTSLICALQECDNDTEAHVQRTQIMGAKLSKRMGLSDLEQSTLSLLCILHDIGKIGIPLDILNKPGKLTDMEWAVLKTHVEKGYQIAKSSQELSGIADMVRYHHERWDGHGYPDGISGEDIPLLSRIISVVDAYDAMVNDRSYRPATTSEKAIAELKRCSGTQFDPNIVTEFVALLESDPSILALTNHKGSITEESTSEAPAMSLNFNSQISTVNKTIHPVKFSRYVLDADGYVITVDDNFESLTGYTAEDVKQRKITQTDLIFASERTDYFQLVSQQLSKQPIAFFEHRLKKKDGSASYVFCCGKLFYDSASRTSQTEIIIINSSDTYTMKTMLSEEYMVSQSSQKASPADLQKDYLTSLLNPDAFQKIAAEKLMSDKKKAMLLVMDVDRFKEFNENFGLTSGDEFLLLVSQTLQKSFRKKDLIGRLGGDEFVTILFYEESIPDEVLISRAQQICDKINLTLSTQKNGYTLSMGAAIATDKCRTLPELMKLARYALSHAKENGRACLSVYSE